MKLIGRTGVWEHSFHPAEHEYLAFQPMKLREERRQVWKGNRYVIVLCEVYDAGLMTGPKHDANWLDAEGIDRDPVDSMDIVVRRTRKEAAEFRRKVGEIMRGMGWCTIKEIAAEVGERPEQIQKVVSKLDNVVKGRRLKSGAYLYLMEDEHTHG